MAIALVAPALSALADDEATTVADSETAAASTSSAASGEETDTVLTATAAEETEDNKVEEVEDLKSTEVEEITKIPSNFGLWWRSVREMLTLALTWDEMSKAEKALKFAEERMRIAKMIAEQNPNDEKAQEKAQKMIEKAQKFMERVEAKKDKWSKNKSQEEIDRLVADIATHHSNSEVILDEMEKKLPEDKAEALRELREKRAEASQRLLNAIENGNISAETKAHLEEVKARIEEHLEEVRQYNEQRQTLQEQVRNGVAGAAENLEALKEERRTQIQIRTESVNEIKTQLEERAAAGDEAAQKKLEIIEKVQEKAQERIENQERAENGSGMGEQERTENQERTAGQAVQPAGAGKDAEDTEETKKEEVAGDAEKEETAEETVHGNIDKTNAAAEKENNSAENKKGGR